MIVVQLDPRFSAGMYIKTAIILLTLAASATYAFYSARTLWVRTCQLEDT